MTTSAAAKPVVWYQTEQFRRAAIIALVIIGVVEGIYAVFLRRNDFVCHVTFGEHFRQGTPYASPGNYYPLGRVMLDAALTFGNYYLTRAICYALALAALAGTFWIWQQSALRQQVIALKDRLPLVVLTIGITLPLLLRDFDECGLQILLLGMLSLGLFALQSGKPGWCGFCLACAATYKATPLLFFPFLLWKREWKAAGTMLLGVMLLNLAPAMFLGWQTTLDSHRHWFHHTTMIMRTTPDAYPSIPGIEEPKHLNESLGSTLARFVETYPPGHPLYIDHPLFVQFGNLPVDQAKMVVTGLTLLLGAVLAWQMRYGWSTEIGRSRMAAEWSVACIFSALLSPICWKQHLVLVVPAVYLVAADIAAHRGTSAKQLGRWIGLAAIAGGILLTRSFLTGRQLHAVLQSYNVVAFAVLGTVFMVLSLQRFRRLAVDHSADRYVFDPNQELRTPQSKAA